MYAQLGNIVFEGRKSFNAYSSTKEVNLVELALIENKPRLQRVGSNLDVVSIGMFFESSFCDPQSEVNKLNERLESSEILSLISGAGLYIGDFVIKNVSVTHSNALADGFVTQCDVTVELIEYYDSDREITAINSAINAGFATDRNTAPEYNPTVEPISDETAQALLEANVMANKVAAEQAKLKSNGALKRKVEDISRSVLVVGECMNKILVNINADPASEVYQRTRDLAQNCGSMIAEVSDCSARCTSLIEEIDNSGPDITGKIANLVQACLSVQRRSQAVQATSASYNAFILTT